MVKPDNSVRICGDFKVSINPMTELEQFPLSRVEDIFASIGHGDHFSTLDLSNAYLQMEVDDATAEFLTINTHRGLFRFRRMPYGIASAPAIFQRTMESLTKDLPSVQVFLDDMIVTGRTRKRNIYATSRSFWTDCKLQDSE